MAQVATPQNCHGGGLRQRGRVDKTRIVCRLEDGVLLARWCCNFGLRGCGLQVHHPAVSAGQDSVSTCLTDLAQSFGREGTDPCIETVRTKIERSHHQLFKSVDVK